MESKKTSLVQTFEALNVRQAGFLSIYLYLSIAAWLQYINAVPQGRALCKPTDGASSLEYFTFDAKLGVPSKLENNQHEEEAGEGHGRDAHHHIDLHQGREEPHEIHTVNQE
jgi:hypothetical protein